MRWWAFWRRVQYITGAFIFFALIYIGVYYAYLKVEPTCFDNRQNGDERDVDCGGGCTRICALDVLPPSVQWARSFHVVDGQYNAVAYIENKNLDAGSPRIGYTFFLYDEDGLITERSGTTVLPPDSVYPIFEGRINTGARVPTQTFIELEKESLWLPATAGREQFVIEGRELTDADRSPRLTAQVRNTALTDARDLEIVATIFDTRGNALTSSRTVVPLMEGRASEDVVFTWPEPIAKTVRSCEVPTDVVLGIDLSGSMNDDGGNPPEPVTSVLAAASSFVERLGSEDQVSVVTYATEAQTVQEFTTDVSRVGDLITSLTISSASETGSTNTGDAISAAGDELLSSRHNLDARKVLVLLTDGLANAPGDDPEEYALQAAGTLKRAQTEIFTIGLGDNVNETFLQQVATDADYYYRAATTDALDRIYQTITDAICEDGPAVIDIVPKTAASFAPLQ
jgi:Mg-chelatase subunit ChlD